MPSTAVIQVKRGIGDVIWHLPFIRAIAATTPEGAVAFLAPPSTHAKELLQAEHCVGDVIYFEHGGSELRRGLHLARLIQLLRARKFQRIWILDRTIRPALAAMLAGIPERIGPGDGAQRFLITNSGIDQRHFQEHAIDWLRALMAAMHVPVDSTEPDLKVPDSVLGTIGARFAMPRPWLVFALGAVHPERDWSDENWSALFALISQRGDGPATGFLIGGPGQSARAAALIARTRSATLVNACDLSVGEAAALLDLADLFIGPDSGPMNLAAAVGTPSFGLFGVNPVLSYSRFIHPIVPEGGQSRDGMSRISPAAVLQRIEPYLSEG